MNVFYKSTRGNNETVTASQAILQGLAPDGGLYVPVEFPEVNIDLNRISEMGYKELALKILPAFLGDYTLDEVRDCIDKAYDSKFDTEEIAPVVKVGDRYFMELFHGATIAFKDMALSILPHLLTCAAKKNNITNEIVILTATSGDTGKAALAGFADVPGTRIIVFYPDGGVSNIQRLQMVTQKGDNTCVIGVKGNFDDCQSCVKKMFNDKELAKTLSDNGFQFSSANSINIGRLLPQVVYYFWAYSRLVKNGTVKAGDKINFVVPTGNFGNILAGYYAKMIGLPVEKFICASNDNKVLYDFFSTGTYDKNREFILTSSPSMDILISSNLERLIYMSCGEDAAVNSSLMQELSKNGKYTVTEDMMLKMADFIPEYATDEQCISEIAKVFNEDGYVIDTHTAGAAFAYDTYREQTGDDKPTVIVSTASPFKFPYSVVKAIDPEHADMLSDYDLIFRVDMFRGKAGIPKTIKEILASPIRHKKVCEPEQMETLIKEFLDIEK